MEKYIFNWKTALLIGVLLLIGGCSSKSNAVYEESIQKGLDAIAEDNFSKAEGLFEMATKAKEKDPKAKALLNQVQLILKSDDLMKENKIDEALKSLEQSIEVEEGSKVIVSKARDKKEVLLSHQKGQTHYNTLLTDAKNLTQSGDYQKANGKLDELLKADLSQFASIKDEATKLKESNNTIIRNAEVAQAQKNAQAQQNAQAQKNAQAQNAQAQKVAQAQKEAQAKVAAAEKEAKKDIQPNTLSADDVVVHYSILANGELELLSQSIILKVGQRLVLTRDDHNKISERTMFSSDGVIDTFHNTNGFIAIAPGTTDISILPGDDWDRSKVITVTVIN
ncbi:MULTISPECIES: hypothetical protein [unclassified Lysinibacillus]|uniref:hypothetical protein n=1 Tax=unclassified Lysinibacillus TaxID=2636778 RepID=UPI002011F33C|nr:MULTISPECIES: hypothetical protein [unclassified Lysinibacillus]MCL1698182.1 hypothetical protein [Lysinibacillus sp. BPa_S21]MCL1702534.1 hypothetical protein [Lysinibacillus sp. Bpr_S20]